MRPGEARCAGGDRHRRTYRDDVLTGLAFEVIGPPGADAVVLSAGLGGAAAFWQPQVAALAQRHRVVLFDQRGTGANRGPLPQPYSIAAMAADVLDVLDAAGIGRAHLMGHALGGLVGLHLALHAPHRLNRLVLVNAWATLDPHTRRCFAARLLLLQHAGPEAYVAAQPIFLYPAVYLSRHADRIAAEEAHGIAQFQGADTLLARIAALQAFDATAGLGGVAAPTLVAASRDDVLVPYTCSEALAAAIPGADLWLTQEGGHAFCAIDPDPFNRAVLAFLAR